MRRPASLRVRLVALATLGVAVVLVVGGLLLSAGVARAVAEEVERAAILRSRDLADVASRGELASPLGVGDADEALVQVVRDGRVVAGSANAVDLAPLALGAPRPGVTRTSRVEDLPGLEDDDAGFVVASTTTDAPDGLLTVHVASSLEDAVEAGAAAVRVGALAVPLLVLVLGGAMWLLVGRALAPVEAMRVEADAISGGGLDRRLPEPERLDELGRLARTLNGMLARLEDAAARRRRFVADAAHELRTPIAGLRTTLETARAAPAGVDWEDVSADLLAETIRMQRLAEQLLLLARTDAGRLAGHARDVDVDDVVAAAVARLPADTAVDVVTRLVPARVVGEPVLLAQVVQNLVDNAVAHAGERVVVSVRADGDGVLLVVDDDGPGVPTERRPAVFERFARLDASRHRDAGGAGLGLAIVADVVGAHGGTVVVDDAPLGGARFVVRLPASPPWASRGLSGPSGDDRHAAGVVEDEEHDP